MMKLLIILSLALEAMSTESPLCGEHSSYVRCLQYELKNDEAMRLTSFVELAFYSATGSIGIKTFASVLEGSYLSIINSNISEVEDGALCSIPYLKSLELESNEVFPIVTASMLNNCQHLQTLHVSNIELQPTAFKFLTNLETLYMKKLNISHLTREHFEEMKNLKTLHLTLNNFENVEPGAICVSPKLKEINLQFNKPIPNKSWFKHCNNVEDLTLTLSLYRSANVGIEDDIFNNLTTLRRLKLEALVLKQLTRAHLKGLTQLEKLILTTANTETIDSDAFSDLKNLRELRLHSNHLTVANSGAFVKLEKLTELSLAENNLTTIDNLSLPEVMYLNLNTNSIEIVDVNTSRSNFPKLKSLCINDNPMDCAYKEQLFGHLRKVGIDLNILDTLNKPVDDCNYTATEPIIHHRCGSFYDMSCR